MVLVVRLMSYIFLSFTLYLSYISGTSWPYNLATKIHTKTPLKNMETRKKPNNKERIQIFNFPKRIH